MIHLVPLRLQYDVQLRYQINAPGADFILNVQAARTPQQRVLWESLTLNQPLQQLEYCDPATAARFLRLRADAGELDLRYSAQVELQPVTEAPANVPESWISQLPGEVLPYLYPSRYCESDLLSPVAMAHFGAMPHGYSRVAAICEWVRTHVQFASGSSLGTTSAAQTLASGRGVCRDFAHLMIALCRALNIPARFVTGLDYGADPALGPTDFHAYVEAYLGGRWYIFDASGVAIPMGFIRLASGRDAADCAYGSIFGDVVPLTRWLSIAPIASRAGEAPLAPYRIADAISTALT